MYIYKVINLLIFILQVLFYHIHFKGMGMCLESQLQLYFETEVVLWKSMTCLLQTLHFSHSFNMTRMCSVYNFAM